MFKQTNVSHFFFCLPFTACSRVPSGLLAQMACFPVGEACPPGLPEDSSPETSLRYCCKNKVVPALEQRLLQKRLGVCIQVGHDDSTGLIVPMKENRVFLGLDR